MLTGKELGKAIETAITMKGVKKADVAREFGIKPPSVTSWIKTGRVAKEHLGKLIEYFSDVVSPSHFGMEALSANQAPARLRDHYIPPAGGIAVLEETDTTHTHRQIEMYDLKLSAGSGNAEWVVRKSDDPLVFRDNWFRARRLNQNDLRGMHIKGDSMSPVLNNHDTVIIDIADTELVDGEIYAVVYKEKFFIKQIRHLADGIELISFNPEYEPMPVQNGDAEKFQCLGRMVWRGG